MNLTYPWPIGTVHFAELPADVRASLQPHISVEGYVADWLTPHRTPTEGPYVEYNGYKIRVTIETVTTDTYLVRIA